MTRPNFRDHASVKLGAARRARKEEGRNEGRRETFVVTGRAASSFPLLFPLEHAYYHTITRISTLREGADSLWPLWRRKEGRKSLGSWLGLSWG